MSNTVPSTAPKTILTTEIVESIPEELTVNMDDWPEYKKEAKGLIYLEDFDGVIDNKATPIEIPPCGNIDLKLKPQYQCLKCGKVQTSQDEIHRMKCVICYNKAFNKIRPTKWTKFKAY